MWSRFPRPAGADHDGTPTELIWATLIEMRYKDEGIRWSSSPREALSTAVPCPGQPLSGADRATNGAHPGSTATRRGLPRSYTRRGDGPSPSIPSACAGLECKLLAAGESRLHVSPHGPRKGPSRRQLLGEPWSHQGPIAPAWTLIEPCPPHSQHE